MTDVDNKRERGRAGERVERGRGASLRQILLLLLLLRLRVTALCELIDVTGWFLLG
jgi:hypothetical protein